MEKVDTFLRSQIRRFDEFLTNIGVNLDKVRYTTSPTFDYDYKNDIISPNLNLVNGRLPITGPTITLSVEAIEIDEETLGDMINNSELGYVFHLSELTRAYENGKWPLRLRYVNIDEKMEILNDFDDSWSINDDETLSEKVESIKLYFEENISSLNYIVINPLQLSFIQGQAEYNIADNTYAGLPLKVNANIREDIISLSTYDESFYLKIYND